MTVKTVLGSDCGSRFKSSQRTCALFVFDRRCHHKHHWFIPHGLDSFLLCQITSDANVKFGLFGRPVTSTQVVPRLWHKKHELSMSRRVVSSFDSGRVYPPLAVAALWKPTLPLNNLSKSRLVGACVFVCFVVVCFVCCVFCVCVFCVLCFVFVCFASTTIWASRAWWELEASQTLLWEQVGVYGSKRGRTKTLHLCYQRLQAVAISGPGLWEPSSGDLWIFWRVLAMALVIVRLYESKGNRTKQVHLCRYSCYRQTEWKSATTQERHYRWFSMACNGGSWQCKTFLIGFANVVPSSSQMWTKHWWSLCTLCTTRRRDYADAIKP